MIDDTALLARYAATRDAEAFADLVGRYAGFVHATCRRVCGNAADAEDATQEVFLALARQAGRIRAALPPWLHTVAVRRALRLRSRASGVALDSCPHLACADEEEDAAAAAWRTLVPRLDEALDSLPDGERTAVILRHLHGLSQGEIGERMGLSQPTIHRRLSAGIDRLRQRLGAGVALALVAAAGQAAEAAPPAVIAGAGRIALAGPDSTASGSWWSTLATASALTAATVLATALIMVSSSSAPRGGSLASADRSPAVSADPAPPSAPAADPPALASFLDRPLRLTVERRPLTEVVDLLRDRVRPADGERIEIFPQLWQADPLPRVTLAVDGASIRDVLDRIAAQTAWRWRLVQVGRVRAVVIDRAMPLAQRQAAVRRSALAMTPRSPFSPAAPIATLSPICWWPPPMPHRNALRGR